MGFIAKKVSKCRIPSTSQKTTREAVVVEAVAVEVVEAEAVVVEVKVIISTEIATTQSLQMIMAMRKIARGAVIIPEQRMAMKKKTMEVEEVEDEEKDFIKTKTVALIITVRDRQGITTVGSTTRRVQETLLSRLLLRLSLNQDKLAETETEEGPHKRSRLSRLRLHAGRQKLKSPRIRT